MSRNRTALVLVDLQHDFLSSPRLQPPSGALVERAEALLTGWRARSEPVVHLWTTVTRAEDRRMPHWRRAGLWRCEEGTHGHATPAALAPREGELVVHKTDYDGFADTSLPAHLRGHGVEKIVVAGTHLHACVRATALGAYRNRLDVVIAEDATGTDDPVHAAATRAWLGRRSITFRTVAALLEPATHRHQPSAEELPGLIDTQGETRSGAGCRLTHEAPAATGTVAWSVMVGDRSAVDRAVRDAAAASPEWIDAGGDVRIAMLNRLADQVQGDAAMLADAIVADVGKPIAQARAEVSRAVALLRAAAARGDDTRTSPCGPASVSVQRPLGTVALITPWNNPLAIPVGKIAPALAYGNTLTWKPSPAGTRVAVLLLRLAIAAGLPPGVVTMVAGGSPTASDLMAHGNVDAVSLTGGEPAGWAARIACARGGIPLQAELGGNNPALVSADTDLDEAAVAVAEGAFAFSGQRCTANRRVIVERPVLEPFLGRLREATAEIAWARPSEEATVAGPLISTAARTRVEAALARAVDHGASPLDPPAPWADESELRREGAYMPPAVVRCDDPTHELVQEETFGPVLVVQPAQDWDEAITLANGVRHGLAAAAFTSSRDRQQAFRRHVRAGMLKLGSSTAGADIEAPFGGWKHSGVGPPEHGAANRSSWTRQQAIYETVG
ncbi:MAG: aldehyde dehydrogenase family protein [Solirubrobacterales bacterium]